MNCLSSQSGTLCFEKGEHLFFLTLAEPQSPQMGLAHPFWATMLRSFEICTEG